MIHLACKVPKKVLVACSGGPDSLFLTDLMIRMRKDVRIAFFHHGTEASQYGLEAIEKSFPERDVIVGNISREKKPPELSWEEFWREERQQFLLETVLEEEKIATGHHLDDQIEWYLISLLRTGKPKLIKPAQGKLIKPLLLTPKKTILERLENNPCLKPYTDPTNTTESNDRGFLRKKILGELHLRFPGMHKAFRKLSSTKEECG